MFSTLRRARSRIGKTFIGRAVRYATENRLVYAYEKWASRRILDAQLSSGQRSSTEAHILIAAPGRGNIGDQAMFEAFVNSIAGPVTVVVRQTDDLLHIPDRAEGLRVLALPAVLYGGTWAYLRDLRRLAPHLAHAHDLSVVGADVMDGAYRDRASVRRFRLAELASRAGVPSRVLGFSWNAHPTRGSAAAMKAASGHVDLFARDPKSAERLLANGASRVYESADIAFLTQPADHLPAALDEWLNHQSTAGRPVVIVNANYLLEAHVDQVAAYRALIEARSVSTAFVILPHDSRNLPSDETLARLLFESLAPRDNTYLIERVLTPGQVALLASRASFVMSGRMHLTIISSTVLTPAVSVSYQGKVEGLYRKFGFTAWIDPDTDFADSVLREFDRMVDELEVLESHLQRSVPQLKREALKNIYGLEPARTPSLKE